MPKEYVEKDIAIYGDLTECSRCILPNDCRGTPWTILNSIYLNIMYKDNGFINMIDKWIPALEKELAYLEQALENYDTVYENKYRGRI